MKNFLKDRKTGVYVLLAALLLQSASLINYLAWAIGLNNMDAIVMGGLALGLLTGIGTLLLSSDLLVVVSTALCSCGVLQLVVTNAGSFADAYQGIVMFGDPSQVGRILSICITAVLAVVMLIIAGFMGFGKQKA